MFYLLLICVFVEFDQTIHLRPVHFTMCKLHLHFLKKKERKKLQWESFIELPNITKLEIKLKSPYLQHLFRLIRGMNLSNRTLLFASWNAILSRRVTDHR